MPWLCGCPLSAGRAVGGQDPRAVDQLLRAGGGLPLQGQSSLRESLPGQPSFLPS